ncbi:carbohydrate-responsive element-binding protein isoform 3-T3 [Pholidichthys leucotaenia]
MASRAARSQLQDLLDSDSEPDGDPVRTASCAGLAATSLTGSQVIHSGHFMVSSPHSDSAARRRKSGGFDTVNRTWCQTYRYGPLSSGSLSIDPTLTRLFECMSLAYSGKIVSPKWKSFKGLRLLWRDKIRLNNAIWRAWFIQYVEKRKNPVCGFVIPLDGSDADAHRKPEAIILEGSYWKRRIEVVIKEYHKWRIYYKKRLQKKKDDILSMLHEGPICQAKLDRRSNPVSQVPEAAPVEAHMFDLDCLLSDISDTLFTMTQKPCPWSGDRHSTYTSNADIIQPGLTPLQPNLDDFMDIPEIFLNSRGPPSEHTDFADCGYYESTPGTAFAPVPPPVVPAPQLLIDPQLIQPSLSSDNVAQPSTSSTRPDETSLGHDYQSSSIMPGSVPYGHQSYHDAPVSVAYTSTTEQPALAGKPTLGFDTTLVTDKSQISSSSASLQTSSSSHVGGLSPLLQHGGGWLKGIPTSSSLQPQSAPAGHTGACSSTSTGSAVSALLTHKPANTGTALLVPKTEKLSPVQLYSADRSSLTVNFLAHPGQTSPPNPLDAASNPESPHSAFLGHGKLEPSKHTETRRITHISAEQKRRFNIKLGFDTLHNLVTTLSSQPSIKISKATTLQKTAEYISKMQQERAQLHEEAQRLREEIQVLNTTINMCQQQLPATGVPITRQRFDHMRQKFREYVRAQTLQNWKFWIFSVIIESLFESYNGMVSTASVEDLCRSTLSWLDQHCSLPALRPLVLSSLRLLSTTTAILTDPGMLPEQAALAVTQTDGAVSTMDHSLQTTPPKNTN